MSKKTTVVKTPSVTELMEGVRAPIKQWSSAEYEAGNSQAIANTFLEPIVATLRAAKVTCLRKPTTPTGKKRAKLVSDAIISGFSKTVQADIVFVRSFSGGKGNNSWKSAARLRGDSPTRITSMQTNSNKPSALLGKIDGRLAKAIAKEEAIAKGEVVAKKTPLDTLSSDIDRVIAKLKANDDFPSGFNNTRRGSLKQEMMAIKKEIDDLNAASKLTA